MYEKRLHDIMYVLIGKENDVVSEHVGLMEGKFRYREFRVFDGGFLEASNIEAMASKIHRFRQEIRVLQ